MADPTTTRRRRRRAAVSTDEAGAERQNSAPASTQPASTSALGSLPPAADQNAAPPVPRGNNDPISAAPAPISDLEAARKRTAEIMDHGMAMDEGTDKFEFDRRMIPDGWDYAWKRLTVMGQEDPAYQVQLSRNGWEPVPAARHPEMMPADWKHSTITRDGQILMQRPMEITERSRLIEKRRALDQVRVKEAQLNSAPNGTFERGTHPGAPVRVKKGYEAMPIPE